MMLYGSTGHALSVREQIRRLASRQYRIVGYIDDYNSGMIIDGVPVIDFAAWQRDFRNVPVLITIGSPASRWRLAALIEREGGRFISIVGDWPSIAGDFTYGTGCFTGGPNYIGPNVSIGNHVQVQPMTTIAHDCKVGDFTTICTSNIAGWVLIESDVFIGLGTCIVNGTESRPIRIGRGSYICAGSVVTKSVPAGTKVGGNPARDLSLEAQRRRRAALR